MIENKRSISMCLVEGVRDSLGWILRIRLDFKNSDQPTITISAQLRFDPEHREKVKSTSLTKLPPPEHHYQGACMVANTATVTGSREKVVAVLLPHISSTCGEGGGSYDRNRVGQQVASWRSATSDTGPPVIKWAPGSLMFATGSSELSFWIPDLSKLGAYVGRK
ncbi:hypothetical protein VNO77_03159 [Canavalia gladiata]|uniref:Uncharacterized protein n=1 Tax=Canavalia gladiata TaxID=3824 RepID=A0AAN9MZV9_CANGL